MIRNILKYGFIALTFIMLMSSCSTYEKFKVTAPIGTSLSTSYNPSDVSKINYDGQFIDYSISSDIWCGYIIFTDKTTGLTGPYGLNLKHKAHPGEKFSLGMGYTLMGIGIAGMLVGTIGVIADNENTAMLGLFGGSTGLSLLGGGMGATGAYRSSQLTHEYQFTYQKKQYVDYGQLSTTLLHPDPEKEAIVESVTTTKERTKATSGTSVSSTTATGSKANKTKSDNAKKVSGTYNGTGKLLYGNKTDENYSDISIVVERIDKDHVSVIILESGEEYFSEPLIYTIVSGKGNSYLLKIENVPDATMTIDSAGKCTFTHKQVIIDGEIYTLSINAAKG